MKHLLFNKAIEVNEYGSKGKTLFLLSGWTHDFNNNTDFIKQLSRHFRLIVLSYPGYSGSKESASAQSMTYLARLVNEVVEEFRLKDVVLVGFSMGAQVTLAYMKHYSPEQKAVLIAPTFEPFARKTPWFGKAILSSSAFINLIRRHEPVKHNLVNMAYRGAQDLSQNQARTQVFVPGVVSLDGAYDTLVALLTDFTDPKDYLDQVQLIYGEYDALQTAAKKQGVDYEVVTGSGHYPFESKAKETVASIRRAVLTLERH